MFKNAAKITGIFALILIFIVGSFGVFISYAANDHSNVMRKANAGNPNFGNSLVYDIAMLGTHDAMSDKIGKNSEVDYGDDIPDVILPFMKLSLVRAITVNYCRTQSVGLREQLRAGARYVDARITYRNGVFYGTHGLVGGKLEGYLKELITFLLDNPGEFVVLNIAQYNKNEGNTETQLAEYMQTVKVNRNGKDYNIYDFINYDTSRSFSGVTYNDVTNNGTKGGLVIVSRPLTNRVNNPSLRNFFNYKASYAIWYNKSNPKELLSMADGEAEKYKNRCAFRCNGFHTTQNATSIALHLSGSLIKNAESENVGVIDHSHFDYWLSCTPIACFDEVVSTKGNFNSRVNDKILNYNLSLNKSVSQIKYNKVTSESQLKDGMRIVIKEVNGVNGYVGNSFKSTQVGKYEGSQFILNDDPGNMWILKKTGNEWKIKRPDGTWLNRNVLGYLVDTKKEDSGVKFKFDFTDSGTAKVHYDKYYMYIDSKKTLDLSKKYSSEFEIYA